MLASTGGCANVMYEQHYRSVELVLHMPAQRSGDLSSQVGIWLPSPEQAMQISGDLDAGQFSLPLPKVPETAVLDSAGRATVMTDQFRDRVCLPRFLGLVGHPGAKSRPVYVAVIREAGVAKLT